MCEGESEAQGRSGMEQMSRASEAGHWYHPDGTPCYEVERAKPGPGGETMRAATVRDARRLGLLPGVTTVLGAASNAALTTWRINQAVIAAVTHPKRQAYETGELAEAEFTAAVNEAAGERVEQAASSGTEAHEAVASYLEAGPVKERWLPLAKAVAGHLAALSGDDRIGDGMEAWVSEQPFASVSYGYGGKVDLYAEAPRATYVVDLKTRDFGPDAKAVRPYDSEVMQLAAYAHGLGYPEATLVNIYASRSHPGEARMVVYGEDEATLGWARFECLLAYFKLTKGLLNAAS